MFFKYVIRVCKIHGKSLKRTIVVYDLAYCYSMNTFLPCPKMTCFLGDAIMQATLKKLIISVSVRLLVKVKLQT